MCCNLIETEFPDYQCLQKRLRTTLRLPTEVFAYVGLSQDLKALTEPPPFQTLAASYLHWGAGSWRSFAAIQKQTGLSKGSTSGGPLVTPQVAGGSSQLGFRTVEWKYLITFHGLRAGICCPFRLLC